MKILSITHQYPPYFKGGRAKHIENLLGALSELGIKPTVITLGEKQGWSQEDGVDIYRVRPIFPLDAINKFYFMIKTKWIIKKFFHIDDFDAILSHNNDGVFINSNKVPFVVKLHGLWIPESFLYKNPITRTYFNIECLFEKKALLKADKLIAVSEMIRHDAKKAYGVDAEVHPNAISSVFKSDALSQEGRKSDILMVGPFIRRKGVKLIPEILNFFKKKGQRVPKLVHLGEIKNEKLLSEIIDKLKSKGLEDKLETLGFVERDKLRDYYANSNLMIHPALYDAFPKAPMEALSLGTEVVVSEKTGGYRELSEQMNGIYISSFSDFAEKVFSVYNSEKRFEPTNIIRGWDEVAMDTLELLQEVTSEN